MINFNDYQKELYIEREIIQAEIKKWLHTERSKAKPLYAIKGDIGMGKTWLLKYFETYWTDLGRPTLWLDAKHWLDDRKDWFTKVVNISSSRLGLNLYPDMLAMTEVLGQISQAYSEQQGLLLVDSVDMLNEEDAWKFEQEVLLNLIKDKSHAHCSKMLLAIREQLHTPELRFLDYNEASLQNWDGEKGEEQIKLFLQKAGIESVSPEDVKNNLFPIQEDYHWQLPRLNTCLVEQFVENGHPNDCTIIYHCLEEFIDDTAIKSDRFDPLKILIAWAGMLEETFTSSDISSEQEYLLELFIDLNLVKDIDYDEYEIIPGLREALHDYYYGCLAKEH